MSRPCLEVDDEPHTCAFCEEHLALDFSTVNGAVSPARLERMKRRLIQVGLLGPNENLNDEKYSNLPQVLEKYHIYDVDLNLFWSEAADACLLAERIRKCMGQRLENDVHHFLIAKIQKVYVTGSKRIVIFVDNAKFEPWMVQICPSQLGQRLENS